MLGDLPPVRARGLRGILSQSVVIVSRIERYHISIPSSSQPNLIFVDSPLKN